MQNHSKILSSILVTALMLIVFSTTAPAFPTAASTTAAPAADATAPAPEAATTAIPAITKGTVVETMASGGYTYLCIENEGQKRWAAIPKTELKVGQQVELIPGVEMGKFNSKTLNRTFDAIIFCRGLVTDTAESALPHPIPEQGKAAMPPGHGMPAAAMPPGHANTAAAKPAADLPPAATIAGTVTETFDAAGYTYVAVAQDGENVWVASPPIEVAVGQEVSFKSGFVMKNFTSKALGRTFESIVFTNGMN